MTTFTELPNFPQVSQLHSATADGFPDENASWNCVPASLSAGIKYLTGANVVPDALKDAVYGQGYTGGQAAADYVAYLARRLGVGLAPFTNVTGGEALVQHIHQELEQSGHPVVATIPSQWGTPYPDPLHPSGTTHVVIFYGWAPGELRAMNPWIAPQPHDGSDAYWAARLCFGQVWDMEALNMAITLERDAAGKITGAHNADNPAVHIGAGAAFLADQQHLLDQDITLGEQPGTANGQPAAAWVIAHRYVGAYGQASGNLRMEDWYELAQQVEALAARANQPQPQQQPPANVQAVTVDLQQLQTIVQQTVADALAKLGGQ